jgi:hypothetical protein
MLVLIWQEIDKERLKEQTTIQIAHLLFLVETHRERVLLPNNLSKNVIILLDYSKKGI